MKAKCYNGCGNGIRSDQQAARAAFSAEDWLLLADEPLVRQRFAELTSVEDVEEFVYGAYDRLRVLRDLHYPTPAAECFARTSSGNVTVNVEPLP